MSCEVGKATEGLENELCSAQFGLKISYKVSGPTPICIITGFIVHRLALNLYNNHER